MSHKAQQDEEREGYPFTARQRRRKLGSRMTRKQARTKLSRPKRQLRSAPRRKA